MMRALTFLLCMPPLMATAGEPSAKATIKQFYRAYLPDLEGEPPFSRGFRALIEKNKKLCAQYSPNEVCGFGASGDPYLNAQEYDDGMTLESTGATFTATKPGRVTAKLNVYPSAKDPAFYTRTIEYKLIKEHGRWVIDDMGFGEGFEARKGMEFEIEAIREEQVAKGNRI